MHLSHCVFSNPCFPLCCLQYVYICNFCCLIASPWALAVSGFINMKKNLSSYFYLIIPEHLYFCFVLLFKQMNFIEIIFLNLINDNLVSIFICSMVRILHSSSAICFACVFFFNPFILLVSFYSYASYFFKKVYFLNFK